MGLHVWGGKGNKVPEKKSAPLAAEEPNDDYDGNGEEHNTDPHANITNEQTLQQALDSKARARPLVNLVHPHYDSEMHILSI